MQRRRNKETPPSRCGTSQSRHENRASSPSSAKQSSRFRESTEDTCVLLCMYRSGKGGWGRGWGLVLRTEKGTRTAGSGAAPKERAQPVEQRLVDDGDPHLGPLTGGERDQKQGKALEGKRGRSKYDNEGEEKERRLKKEKEGDRLTSGTSSSVTTPPFHSAPEWYLTEHLFVGCAQNTHKHTRARTLSQKNTHTLSLSCVHTHNV